MDKENFCVFADCFATQTKVVYLDKPIVLIAYYAAMHRGALYTQIGFTLVHRLMLYPDLIWWNNSLKNLEIAG